MRCDAVSGRTGPVNNQVSDTIPSNREKSLRNGQALNHPLNRDFVDADLGMSKLSAPLGRIAANVAENEVDCSASHSLKLGIIFMLTDSCQQTV